jgi:adenylate kinase family enzyme
MEKIVVIGSPGAGKTTFAKAWSCMLKIKIYHLDRFFWKPGWKPIDKESRIDIQQKLVQERQWIIEGTYINSSEPRLEAADTIIFLDSPPLVCIWQIIKRHHKNYGYSRRDIPEGCTDKLTLLRLLKVLAFPFQGRKILMQKLRNYDSKQVIRLCSKREVEDFLRNARKHYFNQEERSFSHPFFVY